MMTALETVVRLLLLAATLPLALAILYHVYLLARGVYMVYWPWKDEE